MSTNKNAIGRRKFLGMGAAAAGLGLLADLEAYPQNVNRNSIPSDLKITDMRIAVLRGPGGQAVREGQGGVSSVGGSGGVGGPAAVAAPPGDRCLLRLPERERHLAARSSSGSIPIRESRVTARRSGTVPSRTTF